MGREMLACAIAARPQPRRASMIRRAVLPMLVMVAGLALPAMAQVKLEYKYPEGTSTRYRTTSKTHQVLTLAGMDIETSAEESVISTHSVGKRNPDGTLPVTQKVESLRSQIE